MNKREPGLRHLDDIQEKEGDGSARLGTLLLASLGAAALVFAGVALMRRPTLGPPKGPDALDTLVGRVPASTATPLASADVTFPGLLSDDPRPTTALAALGPQASASAPLFVLPPGIPPFPPAAGDRLSVVPLPAQGVLAATPVTTNPRDPLTMAAKDQSDLHASTHLAEEGHPGPYLLQVSSFKTEPEATSFATILRQRGHHAYTEEATISGRGVWHRVRIGPFRSAHEANVYRADFEVKEHIVPFLVEPEKEKKLVEGREAERRAREAVRHR